MTSKTTFRNLQLGFYVHINALQVGADGEIPDGPYEVASALNSRAYELLEKSLPQSPVWLKHDEQEPEIRFSPYEVCAETYEGDTFDSAVCFSFWVHSEHRVDEATTLQFLDEVKAGYQKAAQELGGSFTIHHVDQVVTEEVVTRSPLTLPAEACV